MEANEQKNDPVTSLPKDEVINDSNDSNNKMNFEEQSNEDPQTENISNSSEDTTDACKESKFKKPLVLIGPKRGKIGKIRAMNNNTNPSSPSTSEPASSPDSLPVEREVTEVTPPQDDAKDETAKLIPKDPREENVFSDAGNLPVPYLEPKWSGRATEDYKLEVLKSGVILEKIDLTERSFHVIGRLPSCHLSLAHPTVSRYHAIIQYRATADEKHSKGFYLYDLESTHGTFWNGHRVKARTYVRLHGGHMIKFGCSQRKYILQAPLEDQEEESELSITELKVHFMISMCN